MLNIIEFPYSMEEYYKFCEDTGFKDEMLPDVTVKELLGKMNNYFHEKRIVATM